MSAASRFWSIPCFHSSPGPIRRSCQLLIWPSRCSVERCFSS